MCATLQHKFLFFLGSSLRKKRSDFTATTGGATCSSCSNSGRVFCRRRFKARFANEERFQGGSSQGAEGECGKWFVSSVFVNMKLNAPTRGTCQYVIQHSIPFANFADAQNAERAEIEMNRNNNILWLYVFGHDVQTGSNYATQSVKRASTECPITMSAQKP